MIIVSVCLPSDASCNTYRSYLGSSYLGHGVSLHGCSRKVQLLLLSGPISSWPIDRETIETVTDFIFLSSKITVDFDSSHEIKTCFFLEEKQ